MATRFEKSIYSAGFGFKAIGDALPTLISLLLKLGLLGVFFAYLIAFARELCTQGGGTVWAGVFVGLTGVLCVIAIISAFGAAVSKDLNVRKPEAVKKAEAARKAAKDARKAAKDAKGTADEKRKAEEEAVAKEKAAVEKDAEAAEASAAAVQGQHDPPLPPLPPGSFWPFVALASLPFAIIVVVHYGFGYSFTSSLLKLTQERIDALLTGGHL